MLGVSLNFTVKCVVAEPGWSCTGIPVKAKITALIR